MISMPKRPITTIPGPIPRVVVLVIILTFVVIMAMLGYAPTVALWAVTSAAATAAVTLRPALSRSA